MTADPRLEELYARLLRDEGAALARVAATYERDPSRREDLLQEICLAIWRALPKYRGDASERTFVFRIAHNRGLTHGFRSRSIRASDLDEAEGVADPAPSPEAEAHLVERRDRLHAAIRLLPLLQREVLTLTLEELSQKEIAEVLGVTENNVAVRLTRARKRLRELYAGGKEGA